MDGITWNIMYLKFFMDIHIVEIVQYGDLAFVFVLLNYVSGVRLLEIQGKRRWGNDPAYQEYVANTPALLMSKPTVAASES